MSELQPLSKVCVTITDGTHYTPKDVGNGIPFLTVKDMTSSGLDFQNCSQISRDDFLIAKQGNSAPNAGDVLFSKDGTVGKVQLVTSDNEFAVLSSIAILRPDSTQLYAPYLAHALKSEGILNSALKKKTGSAIRRIILSDLKTISIPLPPLAEQQRIAAILDKAEEIKRKREQAIVKLDDLAQSTFVEMFGDPVKNEKRYTFETLANLCHRIQIGPFGTQLHEEDYVENGIPLVNPTHIKNGKIYPNNKLTITPEKHASLSQYHLKEGDLILGRRGEMGRCAIVNKDQENWLCGTGSLFLQLDRNKIHPLYLYSVLSSPSMRKHLESVAQGVTMANLNKDIIGNIKISLPSIHEQIIYAKAKDNSKHIFEMMDSSFKNIINLSSSLQHQAFTTGFRA